MVLAGLRPAGAQEAPRVSPLAPVTRPALSSAPIPPAFARPSLLKPFTQAIGDIGRLPSRDNATWLMVGAGAALGTHGADRSVSSKWSSTDTDAFRPGAILGGTPFSLGAAFATYVIGRSSNNLRVTELGSDLVRSQVLSQVITIGVKQTARRVRPDGTSFSFPSGHTAAAFATATVLQEHFGWKVGIPAYAVGAYVAASRVQMKRHYLSDVAFGAALGIVAGRTVTFGRRHPLTVSPAFGPGSGGATLTW
jgi:membrane-associated phospholipid phosphatase